MIDILGRGFVEKIRHKRCFPGGTKLCVLPSLAQIYRKFMSGVDLMDQRVSYGKWPNRCHNWIECWWHHSRSVVLNNCYTIYRQLKPQQNISASDFRLEIAKTLMNVKEKPRFKGDIKKTCWFAKPVRADRKTCSLCSRQPRTKCSKCGAQYCTKMIDHNEPCYLVHLKVQTGRKYI